jgi:hypothetical protein
MLFFFARTSKLLTPLVLAESHCNPAAQIRQIRAPKWANWSGLCGILIEKGDNWIMATETTSPGAHATNVLPPTALGAHASSVLLLATNNAAARTDKASRVSAKAVSSLPHDPRRNRDDITAVSRLQNSRRKSSLAAKSSAKQPKVNPGKPEVHTNKKSGKNSTNSMNSMPTHVDIGGAAPAPPLQFERRHSGDPNDTRPNSALKNRDITVLTVLAPPSLPTRERVPLHRPTRGLSNLATLH